MWDAKTSAREVIFVATMACVVPLAYTFVTRVALAVNSLFAAHQAWFLIVSFVSLVVIVAAYWVSGRGVSWFARQTRPIYAVAAILFGLSSCIGIAVSLVCVTGAEMTVIRFPESRSLEFLSAVSAVAIPAFAAVVEEVCFRGLLLPTVVSFAGSRIALLSTTLLFVLAHMARADAVLLLPLFFAAGFSAGLITLRARMLAPAVVIHVGINLAMTLITIAFGGGVFRSVAPSTIALFFVATALSITAFCFSIARVSACSGGSSAGIA
jgi:membrane protease YdiL (CAAX protease family)